MNHGTWQLQTLGALGVDRRWKAAMRQLMTKLPFVNKSKLTHVTLENYASEDRGAGVRDDRCCEARRPENGPGE